MSAFEQMNQPFEEIGSVQRHRLPEIECQHQAGIWSKPNVCLNIARLCVRIGCLSILPKLHSHKVSQNKFLDGICLSHAVNC